MGQRSLLWLGLWFLASATLAATESQPVAADSQVLFEQVFGKKSSLPTALSVGLRIEHVAQGDIQIFSEDQVQVSHVAADVLKALHPVLLVEDYQQLQQAVDAKQRLSLDDLQDVGLKAVYDSAHLNLDISLNPQRRKARSLSLGNKRTRPSKPTNVIAPAHSSAYVNIRSSLSHEHDSDSQWQDGLQIQAESHLKVGKVALENRHRYQGASGQVKRDYSRIVVDDEERLWRLQAGDVRTSTWGFQQSEALLGIQVAKNFRIDPYLDTSVAVTRQFVLDADATVEVFVNDVLRKTLRLQAGEYALSELGVHSGANDIRLQITDVFGQEHEQRFSIFHDARLLNPGVARYEVGGGVAAHVQNGEQHYTTDQALFAAYYEQGVTENLTANLSAKVAEGAYQHGVGATVATPVGNVRTQWGKTHHQQQGGAQAVQVQYHVKGRDKTQLALSAEYRDKAFLPLGFDAKGEDFTPPQNANPMKQQYSGRLTKTLAKGLSASVRAEYQQQYDAVDAKITAGLNVRKQLKGGASANLDLEHARQGEQQQERQFKVSYRTPIGTLQANKRYKTFSADYDSLDNATLLQYQVAQQNVVGPGSLKGALRLKSRGDEHSFAGNMSYRYPEVELKASHRIYPATGDDKKAWQHATTLNVNTAVAYADGEWAVSRPIGQGFALLKTDDPLDKPLAVARGNGVFTHTIDDGDDLPDRYQAVLTGPGQAVITDLSAYQYQQLHVDDSNLVSGDQLSQTQFALRPSYKSGYLLELDAESGYIVDGRIQDAQGEAIVLKAGVLIAQGQSREIPFFTNRSGRFRIPSVPAGSYVLQLHAYPNDQQEIQVVQHADKLQDLGLIQLSSKP